MDMRNRSVAVLAALIGTQLACAHAKESKPPNVADRMGNHTANSTGLIARRRSLTRGDSCPRSGYIQRWLDFSRAVIPG